MKKTGILSLIILCHIFVPTVSYAQSVDDVFIDLGRFVDIYSNGDKKTATKLVAPAITDNISRLSGNYNDKKTLQALVSKYAHEQLGKAYKYGAVGPDSFDCSGLILYVYNLSGLSVPRTSEAQSKAGVIIEKENLQVGDIVFFDTRNTANLNDIKINMADTLSLFAEENNQQEPNFSLGKVTHSGIYIGDNKFIHASSGSVMKIVIEDLDSKYFAQRFLFAKTYLQGEI